MSFFLYKPHVHGPEGITTPDVIIDHVILNSDETTEYISPQTLTSDTYITGPRSLEVSPAYAKIAAGAGTLIAPAFYLVAERRWIVSRRAWRCKYLPDAPVSLAFEDEAWAIEDARVEINARGQCHLSLFATQTIEVTVPGRVDVVLAADAHRTLRHVLDITSRAEPPSTSAPRYSVGPQHGDVKHYI